MLIIKNESSNLRICSISMDHFGELLGRIEYSMPMSEMGWTDCYFPILKTEAHSFVDTALCTDMKLVFTVVSSHWLQDLFSNKTTMAATQNIHGNWKNMAQS